MLFITLNREDFSFVIHLDRQPRTSRRREAQTGSRARSGSRSERTLDAVEHSRTLMEWWPFLIFHRGGLRIKVINNTDNAERKRRFVQEAQATAALEHPHIAVIYEIDDADADADAEAEAEGVTFIAMELIRGDELSDLLAKEKLTVARALEIAIEIGEGLSRAHERGIVHRDLKPANIMITYDGHVKFIDFGLAKLMERAMPEVSRSIIEATFSASESFLRDTDRFDPLQKGERVETLNAIINTRAPPLEDSVDAALTPPLQRVLDGSLAKDATDRYPEMKALLSDLRLAKRDSDSRGSGAKPWRGPRQARALLTPRRSWALSLAIGAAAATIGIYVYSVREPPPPRLSAQFK